MTTEYTLKSIDGNWVNPNGGRRKIKTHWNLEGDAQEILPNIKKMLNDTLIVHNANVKEINALFSIFFNHQKIETEKGYQSTRNAQTYVRPALGLRRRRRDGLGVVIDEFPVTCENSRTML